MLVASCNFMQAAGGAVACAAPDGRLMLQFGVSHAVCEANSLLSGIEALLNQVETWEINLSRVPLSRDSHPPDMVARTRSA